MIVLRVAALGAVYLVALTLIVFAIAQAWRRELRAWEAAGCIGYLVLVGAAIAGRDRHEHPLRRCPHRGEPWQNVSKCVKSIDLT